MTKKKDPNEFSQYAALIAEEKKHHKELLKELYQIQKESMEYYAKINNRYK